MDLNKFFNELLKKTLWMWLPFYAFYFLTKKLFEKAKK
jgi:hypothetical protein